MDKRVQEEYTKLKNTQKKVSDMHLSMYKKQVPHIMDLLC